MSDDSKGDIAKAVAEVVKAVPVYQDAVQPGAKEIGKTLQTVGRTINVALAPVRLVVWGAEQLEEFFATRVAAKMQATQLIKSKHPKSMSPHLPWKGCDLPATLPIFRSYMRIF